MINSNINYGILVWGYCCQRLIKLQKKAIRILCGSKYNVHTGCLFKSVDILTLEDLLNLNALQFYYKYIKDTCRLTSTLSVSLHKAQFMTTWRDKENRANQDIFCR